MEDKIIFNEYAYGCAKIAGSVVVYHAALQYYALNTQQSNIIQLHAEKHFSSFENLGITYKYQPIKYILFKIKVKDPDSNPIMVTSISQTILDCIRNMDAAGGLEEVLNAIASLQYGQLDEKEMLTYLKTYDNASLWSRTGYLLSLYSETNGVSQSFLQKCRISGNKVKNKLKYNNMSLVYIPFWHLSVPENIMAITKEGIAYDEIF